MTMMVVEERRNRRGNLTFRRYSNGYEEYWKYTTEGFLKSHTDNRGYEMKYPDCDVMDPWDKDVKEDVLSREYENDLDAKYGIIRDFN